MTEVLDLPSAGTRAAQPLRVLMLGLRGFPGVQGGVENHVENLAAELVAAGCEVEVIARGSYLPDGAPAFWRGIRITPIWAPRATGVEALVHTLFGVLIAGVRRPEILHIHAIGPALFAPLARGLGLRVVVTHHSPNYVNEKWSRLGRALLKTGERFGMRFANGRIAVSESLAATMRGRYRVPVTTIPNGIPAPAPTATTAVLDRFGLEPGRYILNVARIDEQKRQLDLIEAMAGSGLVGWKLALAGNADYDTDYARAVTAAAARLPEVVMLGHQSASSLAELYSHAGVFTLPSSHEGQPIAALEAISYGCPSILSDIPANREIAPEGTRFVGVGDIQALAAALAHTCARTPVPRVAADDCARVALTHDWRTIAAATREIYLAAAPKSARRR